MNEVVDMIGELSADARAAGAAEGEPSEIDSVARALTSALLRLRNRPDIGAWRYCSPSGPIETTAGERHD